MRITIVCATVLILAACSGDPRQENVSANGAEKNITGAARTPDARQAPAPAAEGATVERDDEVLRFSYGWPAAARGIEPLDRWLKDQAEAQYREAHRSAEEGRELARSDGYPFNSYSYEQKWQAVADTPQALVMQGDGYNYTGGAHGLPFTVSLIWDRGAKRRLALADVVDAGRLSGAARGAFCKELDRQRAEKRGAPVDPQSNGDIPEFNRCVDMRQQEILPVSRAGKALDTIRVVIGPYAAGPYAEGTYEINLPLTPAMMNAVRPAYRGWFSTGTP